MSIDRERRREELNIDVTVGVETFDGVVYFEADTVIEMMRELAAKLDGAGAVAIHGIQFRAVADSLERAKDLA